MPQISSSEDVYRNLVGDPSNSWLHGLVAFAVFEQQRIEWMQHFRDNNKRAPSTDEVTHWYQQQPDGSLLRAKGEAENALILFNQDVLDEIMQQEREDILNSTLVEEIRLIRKFGPQFWTAVAAGLTSALLFVLIMIIVWLYQQPIPLR